MQTLPVQHRTHEGSQCAWGHGWGKGASERGHKGGDLEVSYGAAIKLAGGRVEGNLGRPTSVFKSEKEGSIREPSDMSK